MRRRPGDVRMPMNIPAICADQDEVQHRPRGRRALSASPSAAPPRLVAEASEQAMSTAAAATRVLGAPVPDDERVHDSPNGQREVPTRLSTPSVCVARAAGSAGCALAARDRPGRKPDVVEERRNDRAISYLYVRYLEHLGIRKRRRAIPPAHELPAGGAPRSIAAAICPEARALHHRMVTTRPPRDAPPRSGDHAENASRDRDLRCRPGSAHPPIARSVKDPSRERLSSVPTG